MLTVFAHCWSGDRKNLRSILSSHYISLTTSKRHGLYKMLIKMWAKRNSKTLTVDSNLAKTLWKTFWPFLIKLKIHRS
jgi:hypothetical protein